MRLDLGPVHLLLHLVRHQHQEHVGPLHRRGNAHHLETVATGGLGVAVFDIADDHLEPGVAQVLRLRVPLAAVTERRDQLPLKGPKIGILLQVQSVTFRFLLHFSILSSAEQQRRVRGSPSCHTPRAVSASRSRAAFALPTPVAFLYGVDREFRGYGRMRIAAAILVVGGILLLISWAPAEGSRQSSSATILREPCGVWSAEVADWSPRGERRE